MTSMQKLTFSYSIITFVILLMIIKSSKQECLCSVRWVSEFCGTELNRRNSANNCTKDMYFCGKTNINKPAVLYKACQRGLTCDISVSGGNACLMNPKCQCYPEMRRKRKYCGSQLRGSDCAPNVIYRCPLVRGYNPTAVDACPNGCNDGKCIE